MPGIRYASATIRRQDQCEVGFALFWHTSSGQSLNYIVSISYGVDSNVLTPNTAPGSYPWEVSIRTNSVPSSGNGRCTNNTLGDIHPVGPHHKEPNNRYFLICMHLIKRPSMVLICLFFFFCMPSSSGRCCASDPTCGWRATCRNWRNCGSQRWSQQHSNAAPDGPCWQLGHALWSHWRHYNRPKHSNPGHQPSRHLCGIQLLWHHHPPVTLKYALKINRGIQEPALLVALGRIEPPNFHRIPYYYFFETLVNRVYYNIYI
jgi:hypothetical protein